MKKMRRSLGVLTAAVLMFVFASQAGAYCVHNNSDRHILVRQILNQSFWKPFDVKIYPNQNACCHWSEKDCNKSGGQTDPVAFDVSVHMSGFIYTKVCDNFTIPANGVLFLKGTNGNYSCSQTP